MSEHLTTAQRNEIFYQNAAPAGGTDGLRKNAAAIEEYTRIRMREDGIWRKVLPFKPIGNEDLDRQVASTGNVRIVERETLTDPAYSVPYNTQSVQRHIETDTYPVLMGVLQTKTYWRDLSTLRTIRRDVREAYADNCTKDLLAQEDTNAFALVDVIVDTGLTTPGTPEPWDNFAAQANTANAKQHYAVPYETNGYPDGESFNDALMILSGQQNPLPTSTMVVNSIMINQLQKWDRNIFGDAAAEIAIKGWSSKTLYNVRLIVTIKHTLVGNNEVYLFAEPAFLGRSYSLQDATIHMERVQSRFISFFMFEEVGSSIGNSKAVAKATFVERGA